jgi:hypothetical protein
VLLVGITYVVVPFVFIDCTPWDAGSLYQISPLYAKEVPIHVRAIAVRNKRGKFGVKSMSYMAPIEPARERRTIFVLVRGDDQICCHFIEGMLDCGSDSETGGSRVEKDVFLRDEAASLYTPTDPLQRGIHGSA